MKLDKNFENDISAIDKHRSYTVKTEEHEIISFSLIFIDSFGNLLYKKVYCGKHPNKIFLDVLDSLEENLLNLIIQNKSQIKLESLTNDQKEHFLNTEHCEICNIKFDSFDRKKIKNLDHCHYSGNFRTVLCTMCNLFKQAQTYIPIYMHNFAAYDSKLLIQIINHDRKMRVHPDFLLTNSQKFRYITYNSFKFKDSIEHLPSSLSNLVKELNNPSQKHTFQIIKQSKIIKSFFLKTYRTKN
jgi:hypothetical protein